MSVVEKNNAVIEYLMNCPTIANNPLFFNFAQKENNNQLFVRYADNTEIIKEYIDGSKEQIYTFTMVVYKSVAYNPTVEGYSDENLDEYIDVIKIAEWIEQQNDNNIFPDFGEGCYIDSIETLTNVPIVNTNRTEGEMQPALAQYSLGVRIRYLDTNKVLWNS